MTSKLIVNSIRHTGASADAITMDASGNVTFPANATCSGTATGFGGGNTVAQQFRQTGTTATNNNTHIFTSNWEKSDGTGEGGYGSFADPSSGIFTFPTTGFYLVTFYSYFEDSGWNNSAQVKIEATTNNSSYDVISVTSFGTNYDNSGYNYATGFVNAIVDVTDTSQVKVRFSVYSAKTVSWDGSTSQNRTSATFIRLGDT
tara:strand:- start:55 stop:660 length:606 start_codon:yes stop_codon:yes gene_type:complete